MPPGYQFRAPDVLQRVPSFVPGGKLLADRSQSRLLGKDWPRTLDELEALKNS
jgi:hypothetical protein